MIPRCVCVCSPPSCGACFGLGVGVEKGQGKKSNSSLDCTTHTRHTKYRNPTHTIPMATPVVLPSGDDLCLSVSYPRLRRLAAVPKAVASKPAAAHPGTRRLAVGTHNGYIAPASLVRYHMQTAGMPKVHACGAVTPTVVCARNPFDAR